MKGKETISSLVIAGSLLGAGAGLIDAGIGRPLREVANNPGQNFFETVQEDATKPMPVVDFLLFDLGYIGAIYGWASRESLKKNS